eukprot:TRINITY_DN1153_c0_g1_i1.p1 TRINITY_DN1153_c0_g1~~TRINITY_DN1153_c0_g1_i1.p1  ORF type:complete len:79 (+),score=11.93 TRINITY_DN1153_c0_g1_i1:2-238(+)
MEKRSTTTARKLFPNSNKLIARLVNVQTEIESSNTVESVIKDYEQNLMVGLYKTAKDMDDDNWMFENNMVQHKRVIPF